MSSAIFKDSYPIAVTVGVIISTLYSGIFVMLNNYYVFRPKLERYLDRIAGTSTSRPKRILKQTIIDVIVGLSFCSFCLSSMFLSRSCNNIQTYVVSDSVWMGVYASIVLYKSRTDLQSKMDIKYALKNQVILILCYVTLLLHFQFDFLYISFGSILLGLYLLNQLTNIYFDRIEQYINKQILKTVQEDYPSIERLYSAKSVYPEVESLSQFFRPSAAEIDVIREKFVTARNNMKLKSKALVYSKLHEIFSHVQASLVKYKNNENRKTVLYYGRLNGTILPDRNKIIEIKESYKKTIQIQSQKLSEEEEVEVKPAEQAPQCLMYVFPIKLLENNQGISVGFSLLINIAFGVLLDFSLQLLQVLKIGNAFSCLFSFLVLPIIPKTTMSQLHNTMVLSSVSKMGFTGIGLLVQTLYTHNSQLKAQLTVSSNIIFMIYVQLGFCLYYCIIVLFVRWQEYKFLTICFLGIFGSQIYLAIKY